MSSSTWPQLSVDAVVWLSDQSYRCINTEETDGGDYVSGGQGAPVGVVEQS